MVVSTEASGPTKNKKKRPTGSKSRRSTNIKVDTHLYDQPRNAGEKCRAVIEEDHLYDVVKPRPDNDVYQNVLPDSQAVYQNMDGMYVLDSLTIFLVVQTFTSSLKMNNAKQNSWLYSEKPVGCRNGFDF